MIPWRPQQAGRQAVTTGATRPTFAGHDAANSYLVDVVRSNPVSRCFEYLLDIGVG